MYNRLDRIPACDRRTDGRTDILPRHSPRYAYALRGENVPKSVLIKKVDYFKFFLQFIIDEGFLKFICNCCTYQLYFCQGY